LARGVNAKSVKGTGVEKGWAYCLLMLMWLESLCRDRLRIRVFISYTCA